MLKSYLEKHPYRQSYKFLNEDPNPKVTFEPMRNYLDVSVVRDGGRALSRAPPRALAKLGGSSSGEVRMLGPGVLQAERLRKGPLPQGESAPPSPLR